jgi:hypothetical protein
MQLQLRITGSALVVLTALGGLAWWWFGAPARQAATVVSTQVVSPEVPIVMRTPGGLLEVATVTATERFTRADTREFWGIDLGTTVSQVQVPVHYRYHIELAREMPLRLQGTVATVHAPALRPSLPVAFDTAALQKHTQSGWARFNKADNLDALERSLTAELAVRAASARYLQLATEAARLTVREFVTQWLLKEQTWKHDANHQVRVVFPGEPDPPPAQRPATEAPQ